MVPANKFTITEACKLSISVSGLPTQAIAVYKDTVEFAETGVRRLLAAGDPLYKTIGNQLIINLPAAGTYYITVLNSDEYPITT